MNRERRRALLYGLAGIGPMVCGALTPVFVPTTIIGLVILLVLLRICWLGDNIAHDLAGQDRLPPAYVNAALRRQRAIWAALRIKPSSDPRAWRPALVATRMRAEEQAWYIYGVAAVAGLVATQAQTPGLLPVAAIGLLLRVAMRKADGLAVTLAYLGAAKPLPRGDLLARPAWVPGSRAGQRK